MIVVLRLPVAVSSTYRGAKIVEDAVAEPEEERRTPGVAETKNDDSLAACEGKTVQSVGVAVGVEDGHCIV